MIRKFGRSALVLAAALVVVPAMSAHADNPTLIATASLPATYEDLNNQTAGPLENTVPGNRLGGLGSSIAYAGGDTFLMLPDRGPNAVEFASSIDNTVSYINRFHTFNLRLLPKTPSDALAENNSSNPNPSPDNVSAPADVFGLPFILTPTLRSTTLLWSPTPLAYGKAGVYAYDPAYTPLPQYLAGNGGIGSGVPTLNGINHRYYFTGRSDGFVAGSLSNNPNNARLDPESIKVSNDGLSVFISDEYGPYVYQFDRATGERVRSFKLPDSFAVYPDVTTAAETGSIGSDATNPANAQRLEGRIANKGAEGLAITPDGRTLAVALQSALIQDGGTGTFGQFTRIVTIDIASGIVTGEYAYPLDGVAKTKNGVTSIKYNTISELLAVNNHEFLVDERDGAGFEGGGSAVYKKLWLIDISHKTNVAAVPSLSTQGVSSSQLTALQQAAVLATVATNVGTAQSPVWLLTKTGTPFLDVVDAITQAGLDPSIDLPAKLEGITFGQDVTYNNTSMHTLYLSSDNDFLASFETDSTNVTKPSTVLDNPSKVFVFAFNPSDLPDYEAQPLASASFPDSSSPEQFPSFLFGPPAYPPPFGF